MRLHSNGFEIVPIRSDMIFQRMVFLALTTINSDILNSFGMIQPNYQVSGLVAEMPFNWKLSCVILSIFSYILYITIFSSYVIIYRHANAGNIEHFSRNVWRAGMKVNERNYIFLSILHNEMAAVHVRILIWTVQAK